MLSLNNITHSFGDNIVLNNLSLTLGSNGIYVIMGNSGCGKTTLLNIISGIIKPNEGTVINKFKKTAYMFQEDRLIPWLSAAENIDMVLDNEKSVCKDIENTLKLFEMDKFADKFPGELSGGMRQRVSLARAIAYGGDLILLDEPFSGLERDMCNKIIDILKSISKNSLIIVVTHNSEYAEQLSSDIIYL